MDKTTIRRGTDSPSISATLTDVDNKAVDLSQSSVFLVLRGADVDVEQVAYRAEVGKDPKVGRVFYSWTEMPTVPGNYFGYWLVDVGGRMTTYPSEGNGFIVEVI